MHEPGASVRFTRRYAAPPADVWAAVTEPESVARWLGRVRAGRIATGAEAELEVDGKPVCVGVRVLEPERRLALDWHPPDEEPSVVRFELTADGDGTMLVLEHDRLDDRTCMRYGGVWTRAVDRLGATVPTVAR